MKYVQLLSNSRRHLPRFAGVGCNICHDCITEPSMSLCYCWSQTCPYWSHTLENWCRLGHLTIYLCICITIAHQYAAKIAETNHIIDDNSWLSVACPHYLCFISSDSKNNLPGFYFQVCCHLMQSISWLCQSQGHSDLSSLSVGCPYLVHCGFPHDKINHWKEQKWWKYTPLVDIIDNNGDRGTINNKQIPI